MPDSSESHDQARTLALLRDWQGGNQTAGEELFPLVFGELRAIAAGLLHNERSHHTLQPTALVSELYLKMLGMRELEYQDRTHFLSMSARAMRQILVDHARQKKAAKRGGDWVRTELDGNFGISERSIDVLVLDEALEQLEAIDLKRARFVELRFFAGMTIEETAAVLDMSPSTAKRSWQATRAWLKSFLSDHSQESSA
jgi:RNA polymerase sigma factor (TIGR02999 family)